MSAQTKPRSSRDLDDVPFITGSVHAFLQNRHLDEIPVHPQSYASKYTVGPPLKLKWIQALKNYLSFVFRQMCHYIGYVLQTWYNVTLSILFGGLGLFDSFSLLFFAAGSTIVLFFLLIWCLCANVPLLVRFYFYVSDKYFGGLGLVNFGNPNLFYALTMDQADAAKKALGKDIGEQKDGPHVRFFDFDVAKLMLQIASVIYEHGSDGIRNAVALTATELEQPFTATKLPDTGQKPGKLELLSDLLGQDKATIVSNELDTEDDQRIRDFAARFDMDFDPISDLNGTSSAFAGFFWDSKSNWIIISFKGTGPIEFGKWVSDFTALLVPIGVRVRGFSKAHGGFPTGFWSHTPYHSILEGVKALAGFLRSNNKFGDDTKINLWFTGHSLGCATASMVYSRMDMNDKDLPQYIELRNAYLFAAPILCDRPSVQAFNQKMMENPRKIKTMWRITSNDDIVATGLPDFGNRPNIAISPNNGFAFAHLGTEIRMRDSPRMSHVTGNHIPFGTPVQIYSSFSKEDIDIQRSERLTEREKCRKRNGVWLQRIPIIGRFVAHFTIFYWDQLDRVALGKCEWVRN